ncbi:MAG: protein translocase subunit SecD [Chloroflexi bacterium]|nr:protein translocase subunit SecD [Chloroflexota bacterium]MYF78758.1 protein translocase subunit SecD [Chloroflexota bacterium]MYK61344.1 protein translocase subunit SecD [Chloroflexota bacterium]
MARDLRGLIFVAALVIIAAVVISIPRVNFSIVNFEFDRGNEDSFLGLSLGLDLQGGTHLIYDIIPAEGEVPTAEDVEAIRTIIERRVNAFGVSEPTVQVLGNPPDRILIQLPGQSQSSLNVAIDGADVTPEDVEAFFETDLGKSGVEVFVNEDASMIVTFDEFEGREADDWLMQFREKHPATLRATFEYEITVPELDPTTSIATDDEADASASEDDAAMDSSDDQIQLPDPIRVAPTTEAVQAAFEAAGFKDVVVSDGTDTILFLTDEVGGFQQVDAVFFEAEFKGELQDRTFDDQGNILPSDIEDLTRQLADIGNFASIRSPGYVTQWTVSGGVQEAKALIGSTAQLEFRERKCGPIVPPADVPVEEWPPDGLSETEWLLLRCASPLYFTEQATNISAEDLDDAFPSIEGTPPEPVVTIVFNESGRDAFFEVTGRVARNRDVLAIYLDNVELVAPTVNTQGGQGIADGRAIISGGDFTTERVRTLAIQLRSGALPAELELSEERSVDAILGADSLQRSLVAGGIGLVLLVIFMISYYKVPGIVASLSLAAYTVMLLGIFKLVPVTMTLSGTAAIILSLGFAVDANVLIAERTKEELRAGRDLLAALNTGFDRAWPSIRDGNISTVITAVVLFWFGDRFSTSIMQGFALTLGIGVLLSMFTAFFASRLMLRLIARTGVGNASNVFVPVADPGAQS